MLVLMTAALAITQSVVSLAHRRLSRRTGAGSPDDRADLAARRPGSPIAPRGSGGAEAARLQIRAWPSAPASCSAARSRARRHACSATRPATSSKPLLAGVPAPYSKYGKPILDRLYPGSASLTAPPLPCCCPIRQPCAATVSAGRPIS